MRLAFKKSLVLSLFYALALGVSAPSRAAQSEVSSFCESLASPNGSATVTRLTPKFNGGMRGHKSGGFTTYSGDGVHVVLHQKIYPDSEQVEVHKVATGELVGSFLWKSPTEGLASLNSVAVDGRSGRLIAHGYAGGGKEDLTIWNYGSDQSIDHFMIPEFKPSDFQKGFGVGGNGGDELSYSTLQSEHPYILRSRYSRNRVGNDGFGNEEPTYAVQLINWETKRVMNVVDIVQRPNHIVTGSRIFNSKYKFAAIPSGDYRTINFRTFAQLEAEMEKSAGVYSESTVGNNGVQVKRLFSNILPNFLLRKPRASKNTSAEFATPVVLNEPIRQMIVIENTTFVVTQTSAGTSVWDARTGEMVAAIPEAKGYLYAFEKMGVIAYTLPNYQMGFFSVFEGKTIAILDDIAGHWMPHDIAHWKSGEAYINTRSGRVFKISEQIDGPFVRYSLRDMDINLDASMNTILRTALKTEKDEYYLVIDSVTVRATPDRNEHENLRIHVYSLTQKKKVAMKEFEILNFQREFTLDPSRTRVFVTANDTDVHMINLPNLLKGF